MFKKIIATTLVLVLLASSVITGVPYGIWDKGENTVYAEVLNYTPFSVQEEVTAGSFEFTFEPETETAEDAISDDNVGAGAVVLSTATTEAATYKDVVTTTTTRPVQQMRASGSSASTVPFTYTVSGGNATITKYTGADTEVVIPSEIDGNTVTTIGNSAFRYCTALTSITIPDSVTSIGGSAFSGCTKLATVKLGTGAVSSEVEHGIFN